MRSSSGRDWPAMSDPAVAEVDVGEGEVRGWSWGGRVDGGEGEREAGGRGGGGGRGLADVPGLEWLEEDQGPLAVADAASGISGRSCRLFLAVARTGSAER